MNWKDNKPKRKKAVKNWPEFDPSDFNLRHEIEEGYVISDSRNTGYNITREGRFVYGARSLDEGLCWIDQDMKKQNFFANIFYMNDRGNVDLVIIKSKSGKCTSQIVYSWV